MATILECSPMCDWKCIERQYFVELQYFEEKECVKVRSHFVGNLCSCKFVSSPKTKYAHADKLKNNRVGICEKASSRLCFCYVHSLIAPICYHKTRTHASLLCISTDIRDEHQAAWGAEKPTLAKKFALMTNISDHTQAHWNVCTHRLGAQDFVISAVNRGEQILQSAYQKEQCDGACLFWGFRDYGKLSLLRTVFALRRSLQHAMCRCRDAIRCVPIVIAFGRFHIRYHNIKLQSCWNILGWINPRSVKVSSMSD